MNIKAQMLILILGTFSFYNVNGNVVPRNYNGQCNLDQQLIDEIASYKDVANRILEYVIEGEFKGKTYDE